MVVPADALLRIIGGDTYIISRADQPQISFTYFHYEFLMKKTL